MKEDRGGAFFPILINVQKFPCLVVGGGGIASRKVKSLLEFNANITVLSPKISSSILEFYKKEKINLIKHTYSKEFLNGFKIVFCATNNRELNQTVHDDCASKGIFINVADNPPLCDFILPATIKRGDLTISISSQGKAPFYTRTMKKKLENFISPVYSDIIGLAGEFRKQLLIKTSMLSESESKAHKSKIKAQMFKNFSSIDWEKNLSQKGKKRSQEYAQKILKEINPL
jgi:precorrin-2 dehydrogenase